MLLSLRIKLGQLEGKEGSLKTKRSVCPFAANCTSCIQSYACQSKLESVEYRGIELLSLDDGDILVGDHQYTWYEWVSLCSEVLGQENYWQTKKLNKLNKVDNYFLRFLKKIAYGKHSFTRSMQLIEEHINGMLLKAQSNPLNESCAEKQNELKAKVHLCNDVVTRGIKELFSMRDKLSPGRIHNYRWDFKAFNHGRPPPVNLR